MFFYYYKLKENIIYIAFVTLYPTVSCAIFNKNIYFLNPQVL